MNRCLVAAVLPESECHLLCDKQKACHMLTLECVGWILFTTVTHTEAAQPRASALGRSPVVWHQKDHGLDFRRHREQIFS